MSTYLKLKDKSKPLYVVWSDNVEEETYTCYVSDGTPYDPYSTIYHEFSYEEVAMVDTNPYLLEAL